MTKGRVVLLPIPTAGHIMSMLELAKLLHRYHFSVTILVAPVPALPVDDCIATVAASGLDIDFCHLQPVDLPNDFDGPEDFISAYMEEQKHLIKSVVHYLLRSGDAPLSALIVNFFATGAIDVAADLDVPCYVYFASNAAFLALMLYLPTLEEKFNQEFEEMEEEVRVPGVCPIPPISMPSPFLRKKSGRYTCFVHHGRRYSELKGIVINTFVDLEPATLRALEDGLCAPGRRTPPVYPVGPLIAREDGEKNRQHECVVWLDGQPARSVVFLCFGSRGCFNAVQVGEIAAGLERSGSRFLWALRVESDEAFGIPNREDARLEEVLPEGFLERTKARGMVWPSWAPQAGILAHRAVGGFVTHCGWNSCLESLQCGVPLLGWPLHAEQHSNAVVMAEEMGVALQLKVERANDNFVKAEELERGVRTLMGESEEGRRVRAKAEETMAAAKKAREEGGSSLVNMQALVEELLLSSVQFSSVK
ncbi:UDP-glycosyltransferase 88B1-like [Zingiber officinale]|uniref:UDP-glycosyltransferase 88B1-like n=1 Tax=Zingiber officinale TaxID=94328 RepID=UPI001C4AAC1B|nr:UDP-glycosyltransferase 88B1-like [Zingiber officinale]